MGSMPDSTERDILNEYLMEMYDKHPTQGSGLEKYEREEGFGDADRWAKLLLLRDVPMIGTFATLGEYQVAVDQFIARAFGIGYHLGQIDAKDEMLCKLKNGGEV